MARVWAPWKPPGLLLPSAEESPAGRQQAFPLPVLEWLWVAPLNRGLFRTPEILGVMWCCLLLACSDSSQPEPGFRGLSYARGSLSCSRIKLFFALLIFLGSRFGGSASCYFLHEFCLVAVNQKIQKLHHFPKEAAVYTCCTLDGFPKT